MCLFELFSRTCRTWIVWIISALAIVIVEASSEDSIRQALDRAVLIIEDTKILRKDEGYTLDSVSGEIDELRKEFLQLEELSQHLLLKQSKVDILLENYNARQFQVLLQRLDEALEREIKLRKLQQYGNHSNSTDWAAPDVRDNSIVTRTTIDDRLSMNTIFGTSELGLKKWILSIIEDELNLYKQEIWLSSEVIDEEHAVDGTTFRSPVTSQSCLSRVEIVQKTQQSLNDYANDGVGRIDHAQGAVVIYSLTSDTFLPPTRTKTTVGSVWWRNFIPSDWEKLLPNQWSQWNLDTSSYFYHSMGFLKGQLAPPETILQPNTLPGSCWPMTGKSGQVTFKFIYPVVIEAFSVEHVSRDLISDRWYDSAPRLLKIVGYPTCNDIDKECLSLGFDVNIPIEIARVEYALKGPSVQTFDSLYGNARNNVNNGTNERQSEVEGVSATDDLASCSSERASCSTSTKLSVAGVTVKVLDNWGNPEFTCLYRLRIHGEPDLRRAYS